MCDGAGDWSDCTARWQAMGGRRIKRSAGHGRVAIPATGNICRMPGGTPATSTKSREHHTSMITHPWMDLWKLANVVLFTGKLS